MSDLKEQLSIEDLTTITGKEPVEGHDEFVRRRVEKRLAAKKAGKVTYTVIDEVAAKFGFNAR